MNDAEFMAVGRLLSEFAWHADRGDGHAMAALFLPTGTLHVGGLELEGRSSIAEDCHRRARNPDRKTRHVWSNLRVERSQDDKVFTTAVQLTFEQTGPDKPTQVRINDLFDTLTKDVDGIWRFAHRVIKREMTLSL